MDRNELTNRFAMPKKYSKYLKADGTPRSMVFSGSSTKSTGNKNLQRSSELLGEFWEYFSSEGSVFASLMVTSFNTVMVGYNIDSDDQKAKEVILDFCDKSYFQTKVLESVLYSLIFGDSFLELIYSKSKKPVNLKSIDPQSVVVNYDKYGRVENYQQIINGQKKEPIEPKYIAQFGIIPVPGSPYHLSLIQPSLSMLKRKLKTDEAIANAMWRHGFGKWIITVGNENEDDIPPDDVLKKIEEKFESINEDNEFVVPHMIKVEPIDEKGIEGVEEYFNYFQSQLVTGMLTLEEALGLGKGSTEACNDKETQVLTERGWKYYWELRDEDYIATYNPDRNKYEWRQALEPVDKYVYDHDGEMIRFKSQRMDMLVTPNHRIWANRNPTTTEENWRFYEAEEIYNSNSHWAIKSKVPPVDEENIDSKLINKMKFIGYFVSEGSINSNGQPYCRLSQKKKNSAIRMKKVINEFNSNFNISYTKDKGYEWHYYNKEMYDWLKQFGNNCYDRRIPREILNLSPTYLRELLFAAIDGDGTYDKRNGRHYCEYATTSKQLADDMQEIATKCGYRNSLIFSEDKRENRRGMWRLLIDLTDKDYIIISPNMIDKEYYKDKVYSLQVPNHIYVTRRNGKIAIQGNTANVKSVMYERLIRGIQLRISETIERQVFDRVLESHGLDRGSVKIKFNSYTERDEALKAKWLAQVLSAYGPGEEKPFTIDEIRSMFGYPRIKRDNNESTREEEPRTEPTEEPSGEETEDAPDESESQE